MMYERLMMIGNIVHFFTTFYLLKLSFYFIIRAYGGILRVVFYHLNLRWNCRRCTIEMGGLKIVWFSYINLHATLYEQHYIYKCFHPFGDHVYADILSIQDLI